MTIGLYVLLLIHVIGLFIGLMGLFYLSLGLFGRTNKNVFTPLLPASAAAIVGGMAIWSLSFWSLPPRFRVSPLFEAPNNIFAVVFGVVLFVAEYGFVLLIRYYIQQLRDNATLSSALPLYATIAVSSIIFLFSCISSLQTQHNVVHAGITAIVGLVITIPLVAIPLLSERQLQLFGFVASVIAVLTQFFPAMLDMLNVAIR